MGWATHAIEELRHNRPVVIRPRGTSMSGKVEDGATVTVSPLVKSPEKGDIVLCRVRGKEYLHLVLAVQGERFLIGNNRGGVNGWVGPGAIYGKATRVERP